MVARAGICRGSPDRDSRSALECSLWDTEPSGPGRGALHEWHAGHALCDAQRQPVRTDMARVRGPDSMKVVSTFALAHAEIYGENFLIVCARLPAPLTLFHYAPLYTFLHPRHTLMDAPREAEITDCQHE